jgi:pimeloyl-ACP methyl ester carboxylesterase
MKPQTRYAQSGDVSIAYQTLGEGAIDVVLVPGFTSHLEHLWEEATAARFFQRLASFARLIRFDKRGTGLSDRNVPVPTLEQRMDDIRAVMDAVESPRAALFGYSEGAPMSMLFAAAYPTRIDALILYSPVARIAWAADYPWGRTKEQYDAMVATRRASWGTGAATAPFSPSLAANHDYREWAATYERLSASPGAVRALLEMNWDIDVRAILPAIRVPTLVLHRVDDSVINVGHGRYVAKQIRGAKYVELPGRDHPPFHGDQVVLLDEVQEFLTGERYSVEPDRILTTVLFTDIVDATKRAGVVGDKAWRELLEKHHAIVRREIVRFRGREIDTAGDGFLISFDGPARAVGAAAAISSLVKRIGLEIRAGVHTGECEVMGAKLSGIAVHIGAHRGPRDGWRGRGVEHGEGVSRRFGITLPGAWSASVEGSAGRVAVVQPCDESRGLIRNLSAWYDG